MRSRLVLLDVLAHAPRRTSWLAVCAPLFLASSAQAKMAPAFAKDLIARTSAIVIATPAGSPYKVRIKEILYTSAPIASSVINLKERPADSIPCISYAGIKGTSILFLKRPPKESEKWGLITYHHDWIPLKGDRVPYSTYSHFDFPTAKNISVRSLGNQLMFTDSFKPKDWRFCTVSELCAELKRLAAIAHGKRPRKA